MSVPFPSSASAPRLTVAMSVYNNAPYLDAAIASQVDSGKPLGEQAMLTNEIITERVQHALNTHDDPSKHRFID